MSEVPHEEAAGPPDGSRPPPELRLRPAGPPSRASPARSRSVSPRLRPLGSAPHCSSLADRRARPPNRNFYNTSNRMTPDGLANLPRDYAGLPKSVPQLGPPMRCCPGSRPWCWHAGRWRAGIGGRFAKVNPVEAQMTLGLGELAAGTMPPLPSAANDGDAVKPKASSRGFRKPARATTARPPAALRTVISSPVPNAAAQLGHPRLASHHGEAERCRPAELANRRAGAHHLSPNQEP